VKIGLISDTHVPSLGKEPSPLIIPAFDGVDLILHAGDVYTQSCIEWLERIAPVRATSSFYASTGEAAPRVSPPDVLELEGYAVGLVHKLELTALPDDVWPGALKNFPAGKRISDDVESLFGRQVDIVVCGYTHEAMIETYEDILFVNPGSPNVVKQSVRLGSVGILELTASGPEAQIVQLASFAE
jgi:putative phosphoesterase